jgi:acyl-CoA thioesterase II
MRANGVLDDEQRLHQCVLAYATDHQLLWTALRPMGVGLYTKPDQVQMLASLDHTIWFHAPFRADEWLLYEMDVSGIDYVMLYYAFYFIFMLI